MFFPSIHKVKLEAKCKVEIGYKAIQLYQVPVELKNTMIINQMWLKVVNMGIDRILSIIFTIQVAHVIVANIG